MQEFLSDSRRRLKRRWDRLRPLPRPQYLKPTPATAARFPPGVFQVPNTLTLGNAALSPEARTYVVQLMERLTPSEEIAGQLAFFQLCEEQFLGYWSFADLTTVLWASARLIRPSCYLEIGVRRGRSAAVVGSLCPESEIYGFDLWLADYAGVANLGPDFVRRELAGVGHRGKLTLVSGDSRQTLPTMLREQTDLFFDLITVDGDHSVLGAAADLSHALPRLKVGGIVALDDINRVPALRRVWGDLVVNDSRYLAWQFADAGFGVAAAIRVGDDPLTTTMRRT